MACKIRKFKHTLLPSVCWMYSYMLWQPCGILELSFGCPAIDFPRKQ
jgi:hypothetical protein